MVKSELHTKFFSHIFSIYMAETATDTGTATATEAGTATGTAPRTETDTAKLEYSSLFKLGTEAVRAIYLNYMDTVTHINLCLQYFVW